MGRQAASAPIRAWRWIWDHPSVLIVVILVAVLWAVAYGAARTPVDNSRRTCEKGQPRNLRDMEAWYYAQQRAYAAGVRFHEKATGPDAGVDYQAAYEYTQKIEADMRFAEPGWGLRVPDPKLPPDHGPYTYPYGRGAYSCTKANPLPSPLVFFGTS